MNNDTSLLQESKSNDTSIPRFSSINSVKKKLTSNENPLQFALDEIELISKEPNLLQNAFCYEFDVFKFSTHTSRPLLVLGVYLLSKSETFSKLLVDKKIDLLSCAYFLNYNEKLYQNNPYHNHIHATDVMQFNMILLQSSFVKRHFTDYEILAAFMSAVAHDIGHIGKNNDFLIKTKHELAIKFNNISCLENYHIEQFHQTIDDHSNANFIRNFDVETRKYMIDIVEYAIIGTDMGVYHGEIKKELIETYNKQFVQSVLDGKQLSVQQKKFLIRAMLHLSDISNPMRPFPICQKWADRVNEEFFNQGDVMKKLGLEVSALCDREQTNVVKNQGGFVAFCVKPLAQSLFVMIDELKWCLTNIDVNDEKWKALKVKQEEQEKDGDGNKGNKDKDNDENKNGNLPVLEPENDSPSSSTETEVGTGSLNSNQSADMI